MQQTSEQLIRFWTNKINDYLREQDFQIDPLPKLVLVPSKQQKNDCSDILISTGGYQPFDQSIMLFIDNRHIKDILRSYCHEMVHHHQWLDNSDYVRRVFANYPSDLINNAELEEIEGEAYLKGNLLFRKFTEKIKKDIDYDIRQDN